MKLLFDINTIQNELIKAPNIDNSTISITVSINITATIICFKKSPSVFRKGEIRVKKVHMNPLQVKLKRHPIFGKG